MPIRSRLDRGIIVRSAPSQGNFREQLAPFSFDGFALGGTKNVGLGKLIAPGKGLASMISMRPTVKSPTARRAGDKRGSRSAVQASWITSIAVAGSTRVHIAHRTSS
jgi:hypothetical protein